jgi:membrane protein implicated in regulation of membrane protease activity
MMRYIRYLFLAVIGIALIIVALANRGMVMLKLAPDALAAPFGLTGSVTLPLFLVIFVGIVAGLLIGFVWEWMREFKYRQGLNKKGKEVHRLEREVKVLKAKNGEGQDDVLALLD